jgi:tight adherence protein B
VRSLLFAVIGTVLIGPTVVPIWRDRPKSKKAVHSRLARESRETLSGIYKIAVGTDHRRPALKFLLALSGVSAGCAWLSGLGWHISAVLGLLAATVLVLRAGQISKSRQKELAASWPGYLERTRAKMLTTSRSLPYVIFEGQVAGASFLEELLQHGRREFENSGDLRKSLEAIWQMGDDEEVTNYVCTALLDTLGSTSSQIESQLSLISATVRSRNELKEETSSRLAGVRTARAFILIIPLGMALVGISFAGSVEPFLSLVSLVQIMAALLVLALCWYWSSKLMAFPAWPTRSAYGFKKEGATQP